ncbi:MAG: ZIP family metal transporter [Ignavibacteriales bacterium]|nr:ZIP family metal transporter [Ignavibacteriales bacterium]
MIVRTFLFGLAAALAEILGGSIIYLKKTWPRRVQETLLALGAGFILALVFLKLVPASIHAIGDKAMVFCVLGFATIHFFEHTIVGHLHFGEETHGDVMVSKTASLSAFSGLFVHAFFDGFTIAIGQQFDPMLGILIFLAVLLHKFPEGLTIGSIVVAAGYSRKAVMMSTVGLAGATMLGVCTLFVFQSIGAEAIGVGFAFSAGIAVYVGASDLIPEINKSKDRIPPLVVFAGMILFYLSDGMLESLTR